MLKRLIAFVLFFVGVSMFCNRALTQPTWTFEPFGKEKKPEQYEDRKLGSIKSLPLLVDLYKIM